MQCSTQGLEYHLRETGEQRRACLRLSVRGSVQWSVSVARSAPVPIAVDAELQLAENLREIAQADDEIDRVLASRRMDVAQLVEDELSGFADGAAHEACVRHPVK